MRIIAHRANTKGPVKHLENTPAQIDYALSLGYWAEVDVWVLYPAEGTKEWWLGHDGPEHQVPLSFLTERSGRLYCHAKNGNALYELLELCKDKSYQFTIFTHDVDEYTITSDMMAWVYPGKQLLKGSICVMPERAALQDNFQDCFGVCTDFADLYNTYDEMRSRHAREIKAGGNASLTPDPEIKMPLVDPRRCVAVYTFYDNWAESPAFKPMHKALTLKYGDTQNVYTLDQLTSNSTLHFTIMQVIGFEQFDALYAEMFQARQCEYLEVIQNELEKCMPFNITFRGLMPIKSGLIMVGFPSIDLQSVRASMEAGFAAKGLPYRKYMNNIVHSTIMRLVDGKGVDSEALLAFGARYADTYFGTLTVSKFHTGVSSWRMQHGELTPLAEVIAPTSSS